MNKNISEEVIEIGGKEYKLFLNRKGITAWEQATKLDEKATEINNTIKKFKEQGELEISDDANPFELYDDEELDRQYQAMFDVYAKFYWVALYTHHKLSLSEATKLFESAVQEYGLEQLSQLASQMITTANTDMFAGQRKNLKALKPTKTN